MLVIQATSVEAAIQNKFYALAMFDSRTTERLEEWAKSTNLKTLSLQNMHVTLCKSDVFYESKLGVERGGRRYLSLQKPVTFTPEPKWEGFAGGTFIGSKVKDSSVVALQLRMSSMLQAEGLRKPILDAPHVSFLKTPFVRIDRNAEMKVVPITFQLTIDRVQLCGTTFID